MKRAVKNDCFLVKRFELGYVFYIIKHATKNWQGFFTRLMRTWKMYQFINKKSVKFDRSVGFLNWNKCVKSIESGNYVSAFILGFVSDFEVSDLPTEDVEVDELARHVHYTVKSIRKLTLSNVQSSVSWPPTGSCINELSVYIPNFV